LINFTLLTRFSGIYKHCSGIFKGEGRLLSYS